jgi:hypothetical protein
MNRAYRAALACGAVPLVVGIGVFLIWLATRSYWLILPGMGTVYLGCAAFVGGVVMLRRFYRLASQTQAFPRRRLRLSVLACAALLMLNFPVAAGIMVAVTAIQTCYVVVVHNASRQPLENVVTSGGGCEELLGHIPPGGTVRKWLWIQRDGSLEFRAVSGTSTHEAPIDGYVTNGLGGNVTVTVDSDGSIIVDHRH